MSDTSVPPILATSLVAAVLAIAAPRAAHGQAGPYLLVVNKAEASLSVVSPSQGRELKRIPTGHAPHEVAVAPDGKTAVVTNYGTGQEPGNTLTLVDLQTLAAVATIDLGDQRRPHGIAWLPDGRRLAVTTEGSGTLTLVDVGERKVVAAIPTGARVSHQVAVTPDGRRAFVANIGSGSVTVVDLQAREAIRIIPTGQGAEGVAVSPDGREVWVTNRAENTISILDAQSLEILDTLPCGDFPIRVVFTPEGRRALVTNARSAHVRVFDTSTRREVAAVLIQAPVVEGRTQVLSFPGSASPIGVLADPDGRHAYVAAASADAVAVLDLEGGRIVRLIPVGQEPDGLAWAGVGTPR